MDGANSILRAALSLAVLALARPAGAAEDPFAPKAQRWDEDYGWMRAAPPPAAPLERIKFLPLNPQGSDWLSLGGEVRQREDVIGHSTLGLGAGHDYQSAMTRIYLHADAHFGSGLRVFGQLAYADEGGRKPAARSFDQSAPDIQQLFVELAPAAGARLRLGRQELPLGDQRLSEVRETYDLRRSFDAARLDLALPARANLTLFSGAPILNRPHAFDDRPTPGERFQGLYFAAPVGEAGLDLFWLTRFKPAALYAEGAAKERRETFGGRLHGARQAVDYNLYAVGQTGRFGGAPIRAWAASADVGWTAFDLPWRPRLGLRMDVASGDQRLGDGELGTFQAPYPNTSYLSTNSAYWPGNAWSAFPLVSVHPSRSVSLYLGAQAIGRMSGADAFYYSPDTPLALPAGHGSLMMSQVYGRVRWDPDRNWTLSATVIGQQAGDAAKAKGGRDGSIVSVAADWKF